MRSMALWRYKTLSHERGKKERKLWWERESRAKFWAVPGRAVRAGGLAREGPAEEGPAEKGLGEEDVQGRRSVSFGPGA